MTKRQAARARRRWRAAYYLRQPYIAPTIEAARTAPPGLSHVFIYHDHCCGIFRRRLCDCAPEVVLKPENPIH